MPLSRAEIQKRYRERKKANEGEIYLARERARQQRKYKPVSELTETERKERNQNINARVRKCRQLKRLGREHQVAEDQEGTSGYNTQDSFSPLIVKLPTRRRGPRKRLSSTLKKTVYRLDKVKKENFLIKRKMKTLQRRLQRLSKRKTQDANLTPRRKTMNFIREYGIGCPKARRQLLLCNVVLHQLKLNSHNKKRGVYSAVAGNVVRKYKCIRLLSSAINVDRRKVSDVIHRGVNVAKLRRRRISMKLNTSVVNFLMREDNSRAQPGKRDAVRSDDGKQQIHVLTDYMENLHQKYLAEYPNQKLSLATFCRMRPKHVQLTSFLSRNVCLCTKHQNLALRLQAIRKSGLDVLQNPEKFVESGVIIEKEQLPDNVVYSRWKRVTLENQKKKMKIVVETVDRNKFHEEFLTEVDKFKIHYLTMRTQYKMTHQLKENLPFHEIVIHMDFAENYGCKTADEIQSAYWNTSQVTLHPMVVYYKDSDANLQHKSYVAVSDTMSHSSGTVLAIIKRFFQDEIDLPGCNEVQYVHYWTDSPTSQYRNRYIFDAVMNHQSILGCPATWNYYESGHGKNVCDGLGGTVKRMADEAVRSGKSTIQDADDFLAWAISSTMKGVKFFFVTKDDCDTMTSTLANVELKPIKGTMQIHSVRLNYKGQLCSRDMSCYCNECISGSMCDTWTVNNTEEKGPRAPKNSQHEHTSQSPSVDIQTQPTSSQAGIAVNYNVGDFIAAVYESNWYVGKVTEVDEEDGEIEVSFMEKRKSLFQWPSREDIIWLNQEDILCQVEPPTASGKSKRMYKLAETDSEKIESIYAAM